MSISPITQNLDLENDLAGRKRDAQCIILVEEDMLRQMKRLAAAKRFRSMSDMVRSVMKQYMDQEIRKG